MNTKQMSFWDDAQLRTAASRERAKAMHELRVHLTGWLRSLRPGGAPRARARECLDCAL